MDLKKLEQAFDTLMSLDGAERDAFLARLRTEDNDLAEHVMRLLDTAAGDDDFLRKPIGASAAALNEEMEDHWIGRQLGPYRVTERIATGGMGAVFLAARTDDQFEQQVAIKVLGTNLQSADAVARFRTERQILASLQHPYIGQLLDGGTTDDGLPFLVMEYIDGEPIDRYCDSAKLDLAQRLQLFKKVCDAVDYAHRNLTVHRDIKPSNVLVTGDGTPKLIDFGIAKPLEPQSMAHTVAVTQAMARAMTPEFASPEQVRGEPITTATDVYSLGVLLYKLLSGRMPYEFASSRPQDIEAAICHTEPTRPSTVIGTTDDEPGRRISEQRATSVAILRKDLAGDLDNIVLKALAKEPLRRYLSLRALVDDIERYERHEPVLARPASQTYRLKKFIRRHRSAVLATTGVVALVVSLVGFYTLQLAEERDRARIEASTARQVTNFVTTLFQAANPALRNREETSPRTLLDAGRERIDEELAGVPAVHAALLGVLANAYSAVGAHDEGVELANAGLAMQLDIGPDQPDKVAIARMRVALALRSAGEYARSREEFEAVLPVLRTHPNVEFVTTLTAMSNYGLVLASLSELELSEAVSREVLALMRTRSDYPGHFEFTMRHNLSTVLAAQTRYAEQLEILEETSALLAAADNASDYNTAITELSLANVLQNFTRYEDALPHYEKAITLFNSTYGGKDEKSAVALLGRSRALAQLGRLDEAEQDIRGSAEIFADVFGPSHSRVGLSAHYLGSFHWQQQGDLPAALAAYERALRIYGESLKPDHVFAIYSHTSIASIYREQGQYDASLERFALALELAGSGLSANHQQVLYSHEGIGQVHQLRNDPAAASAAYATAVSLASRDGSHDPFLRSVLPRYIEAATVLGDADKVTDLQTQLDGLTDD
ncbi:MAG: serine/threonine-protein kinase [Pseudomonadota bacterium]